MAKWMPCEVAALDRQVARGCVAPPHSTIASNSAWSLSAGQSVPTSAPVTNVDALVRQQRHAALDDALVELHVGDAVHEQAADAVGALEDGDQVAGPVELGGAGEARRARSRRPRPSCRCAPRAARGTTQPSSKPLSMIAHSMVLIVTGGSLMPSTHEPSQGAGQTRPVNSGKLLVLWRRSSASFQRPR